MYSQRHYVLPVYFCVCVCLLARFCCFHFYILFALFFPLRRLASEWNRVCTHTHTRPLRRRICVSARGHVVHGYVSFRYVLHFNFISMLSLPEDHVAHVFVPFYTFYFQLFSFFFSRWLAVLTIAIFWCSCIALKYIIRHGVDA